jgi:hypothetical protein
VDILVVGSAKPHQTSMETKEMPKNEVHVVAPHAIRSNEPPVSHHIPAPSAISITNPVPPVVPVTAPMVTATPPPPPSRWQKELDQLESMGFGDRALNEGLLNQYHGDVETSLNHLLHES